MRNASIVKNERGQTIIIYALVVPILILFAGFAIDAGRLYVVKAKLSTAVDGATLTGMKNLASGQTTATTLATNIFDANYGAGAPTPTVTFPTDQYGDQQVQVAATVNVDTFFMRYLSNWVAVPVSDTAVATRGKLVMSIVLDRSGSMCGGTKACEPGVTGDDGGEALASAVPTFVDMFDNSLDEIAEISFSDNTTIDVAIGTGFQGPITTSVGSMQFVGGTFGTGAGTGSVLSPTIGPPLSLADAQNTSVPILPGQNVIKVLVYMTDGLMNTVQDNFHCGGTTNSTLTLINYGGADTGTAVTFLDPTCSPNLTFTGCTNSGETGHVPEWYQCSNGCSSGFAYDAGGNICKSATGATVTTFTPQDPALGSSAQFNRANVTAEAQYRAIQTANTMRAESPVPTYIYTIGLGSSVSTATQAFLAQLANDPSSQWSSYYTFNSTQPRGEFFYVQNCPSTQCTADLTNVFDTIAARVLLRLTQ